MNMQETMITTYVSANFLTRHMQMHWLRVGPNNLQSQTRAQASLKGWETVISSSRWKWQGISQPAVGPTQHQQTCFANVFHCRNFMFWAKPWLMVLLGTYMKMPHLRNKRYFVHFYPFPSLAGWKRGLFTDNEKENLYWQWTGTSEMLFMQQPRIQFRMCATAMASTELLYEADRSKLSKHRPHAERSSSMCLNAANTK